MGQVTTGANRLFGKTTMARASELRRQAAVSTSEINELIPLDSDFPRRASVKRQERVTAGTPSAGLAPTWATVAGLGNLVAHVRTNGRWTDLETGQRIVLGSAERVVLLLDVPAGGNGLADEVLTTDKLLFDDPIKGTTGAWKVTSTIVNKRDGIVVCRVEHDPAEDT